MRIWGKTISFFVAIVVLIAFVLPISRTNATVTTLKLYINNSPENGIGKTPYLIGGTKVEYGIDSDAVVSTELVSVSISYTGDGQNWHSVRDISGGRHGTFVMPVDSSATSVSFKLNAHYSSLLGADSYPENIVGPFKVLQPEFPTDYTATANDDGSVTLSWMDNSNMETRYLIKRVGGTGGDKYFEVNGTTDNQGIVSYVDKDTSKTKNTLYVYGLLTVIDEKYKLPSDIDPSSDLVNNRMVINKAKFGYLTKFDGTGVQLKFPNDMIIPVKPIKPGKDTGEQPGGNQEKPVDANADAMKILEEAVAGASDWAKPDIKQALVLGLTTNSVLGNYQQAITREHFAGIAVKLYEALSGVKAEAVSPNPFTDTTSVDVLKANKLGIVAGVAPDKFAANNPITRQELAVMLLRAAKAAKPATSFDTTRKTAFADENKIAPWALDGVRFATNLDIMKGVGSNLVDPLGNTTREQAIALVKRAYEALLPGVKVI